MAAGLLSTAALAGCAASGPGAAPPARQAPRSVRAYVGATVITAPDAAPIADGVVLLAGDRIVAVGARTAITLPPGAEIVDARGTTITAAFWNTHVHFLAPLWQSAATAPPAALATGLQELATRWGFAHVVDLGSDPAATIALRGRVERGELRGPSIRTAGAVFVAVSGQPVYVPFPLPELATPADGEAAVASMLDAGTDAIKLMTASVVADPPSPVMPVEVVRAVTTAAHARGALVFAHPTNRAGTAAARDGGVDVLAHTAPQDGPWSSDEARGLVAAGVSLVPTLSLWRLEIADEAVADRFESVAVEQVRQFAAAGGTLLFGTDAGYRPEVDPTAEHVLLVRAGLSFAARLAMLTTGPAARFGATSTGRLAPGLDADLVVLEGDPATDPTAFARVRCTLRRGVVVHAAGACGR